MEKYADCFLPEAGTIFARPPLEDTRFGSFWQKNISNLYHNRQSARSGIKKGIIIFYNQFEK
jgi:hypothetical protein